MSILDIKFTVVKVSNMVDSFSVVPKKYESKLKPYMKTFAIGRNNVDAGEIYFKLERRSLHNPKDTLEYISVEKKRESY